MIHFADPYPDELLFSVWVRSADHLHYADRATYFAQIAQGRGFKPVVDLPSHLAQFVAALPPLGCYGVDEIIECYTLYPWYRPFLSLSRAQRLYEGMVGDQAKALFWRTNLRSRPIPRVAWFRYCPVCVA